MRRHRYQRFFFFLIRSSELNYYDKMIDEDNAKEKKNG